MRKAMDFCLAFSLYRRERRKRRELGTAGSGVKFVNTRKLVNIGKRKLGATSLPFP
jgi:hypothetical protein